MSEENLQDILDVVREAYAPTDADQSRVYKAVIAAPLLAAAPVFGKGLSSLSVTRGIGALVFALVLGVGVYWGVSHGNSDGSERQSLRASGEKQDRITRDNPEMAIRQSIRHRADESEKNILQGKAPSNADDGRAAETKEKTATPERKSTGRNTHNRRENSRVAAESTNTLAAEIALVRDAGAAIGAGKLKRARRLLNAHRTRFPKGVMVQERNGLEIIALCKQGKTTVAARRFSTFKKAFPNAPIIIRINQTCEFQ